MLLFYHLALNRRVIVPVTDAPTNPPPKTAPPTTTPPPVYNKSRLLFIYLFLFIIEYLQRIINNSVKTTLLSRCVLKLHKLCSTYALFAPSAPHLPSTMNLLTLVILKMVKKWVYFKGL